nr:CBS domain-containing protein [Tissierella carlieri]
MPNIVYVELEDSVLNAAVKLIDHEIDSLPVVEEDEKNYKVVGRITKTTITRLFVELGKND